MGMPYWNTQYIVIFFDDSIWTIKRILNLAHHRVKLKVSALFQNVRIKDRFGHMIFWLPFSDFEYIGG